MEDEKVKLQKENKRLEEENKKLQDRINAFEGKGSSVVITKTSVNSSIPPSKNPIGIPHFQLQRRKSERKTGRQPGHEGYTRSQEDNVINTERWYPASVCPICGRTSNMNTARERAIRQTVDIPQSILAYVVNHMQMEVKCTCGLHCKGQFPESVNAPVSFGPNITALVSYLSTYQAVPFRRLTEVLEAIFGLHISQSSVANILNRMRKLSKKPYEMIRLKVIASLDRE